MTDNLDFFRGWKCACDDLADFLERMSKNAPHEKIDCSDILLEISNSVRLKGFLGMEIIKKTKWRYAMTGLRKRAELWLALGDVSDLPVQREEN